MGAANLLTVDTVANYVRAHASEIGVFSPDDGSLTASAIQGGNVNFAFCVRSSDCGKAVFVKQAPEYVAVFGPDGLPLTSARIGREVAVMKEWRKILGVQAHYILPKLHHFDDENKVFAMEFLEDFDLLDRHLVTSPNPSHEAAKQLGDFMARTHLATHSSKVSPERAAVLTAEYENRALRDVQLEYVFTKAYAEASEQTSGGFAVDAAFLAEVAALKARYNGETGAGNMSLCHGDLHPGSVMIKVEDDDVDVAVRVIDPEFTVYGPPGLDVGTLLSGYVLAAVHQLHAGDDEEKRKEAVAAVAARARTCWGRYREIMEGLVPFIRPIDGLVHHGRGQFRIDKKIGISDELLLEIEVESVGFAAAEVCRTALGHAGGRLWLQFDDPEVKEAAVQQALSIVKKCMTARHEEGMQVLFDCLDSLQ